MTLEQLRIFVTVAERENMTRAAEVLHIAQSGVSSAIAALEARHAVRLFDRIGRGIALTQAGRIFLTEARGVLARAAAAELALAELGGLVRGTLAVQASQTIAGYWLPRRLVAYRRAHPGIDIRLGIGNTAQAAAAVHEGAAELGFVEGAVDDPVLASTKVAADQLIVVVAPDHPWADGVRRGLEELVGSGEWVLREPGSGTRSVFEAALAARGIDPGRLRVALELPSNEAVRAAVEAGMGATAISASVAAPSLESDLLRHVPLDLPERSYHVLRHREHQLSKAAEALLVLVARPGLPGPDRA